MRITYGLQWGACSTLMLHSLSSLENWKGGDEPVRVGFVKTLLTRLNYLGSEEHGKNHILLMEKLRKNTLLNFNPVPANYVGPDYVADSYAWLIASTNEDQKIYQDILDELGFFSTPSQFNDKNDTYVKLYFMHPGDCIGACRGYLLKYLKDKEHSLNMKDINELKELC